MLSFAQDERFQLTDVFDINTDPAYHHLVDTLGELAQNCLTLLAAALVQWKANQQTSAATLRAKMYVVVVVGGVVMWCSRYCNC